MPDFIQSEFLFFLGSSVIVPISLWLLGKYIPNQKLATWGESWGRKISRKASKNPFGKQAWEKIEDKVSGGLLSFFKGFEIGLNSDDNDGEY